MMQEWAETQAIQDGIDRFLSGVEIGEIRQGMAHSLKTPGKRLRPLTLLLVAQMNGGTIDRALNAALGMEFIHTATLLHDDVVDESDRRRGLATANAVWGNKPSVLVGDFLFSRAFELMTEDGSLKVLRILSHASAVIAEGEVSQLTAQRQIETSEERYLSIIGAKTAALFAAASQISAVVAECSDEQERALEDYGRNLGVAFQLVDDAIDYDSDAAEMGKDRGDDFREGLYAVVSVKVKNPQFEGQTKVRLLNREVESALDTVIAEAMETFLEEHPKAAERIISCSRLKSR